jgi:hypothetical protein
MILIILGIILLIWHSSILKTPSYKRSMMFNQVMPRFIIMVLGYILLFIGIIITLFS